MHGADLAGLGRVYLEFHFHSLDDHQRITLGHGITRLHQALPDVAGNLRTHQLAEFRQVRHVRFRLGLGQFIQFLGELGVFQVFVPDRQGAADKLVAAGGGDSAEYCGADWGGYSQAD
jgi:hypothetical protein